MRKIIVLIFISHLFLYSCKNDAQKLNNQDNVLLAKDVSVTSPVIIDNENNPDWTNSLNRDAFLNRAFKNALTKVVPVYKIGPLNFENVENLELTPSDYIQQHMGYTDDWKGKEMPTNEIKEIVFYEKWFFDKEKLKLSKDVIGWCPVRLWKGNGKEGKKLIFYAYPKVKVKGIKIAENIKYEVPWTFEYPTTNVGFDKSNFLTYIIDGIKSGKFIAYDPIYLVDKSKRKFSVEDLTKYIGQNLNPGLIDFYLKSILFEEDWYFDEKTLSIQKDVKSIAFVQYQEPKKPGDSDTKILFFIFPKE